MILAGDILPVTSQFLTTTQKGKDFIRSKFLAALNRWQLSVRDYAYILQAVVEALDLSCNEFPNNKSSIQRILTQIR